MRRNNPNHSARPLPRNCSQPHLSNSHNNNIPDINHLSHRCNRPLHSSNKPFRILLPPYFNIPKFID